MRRLGFGNLFPCLLILISCNKDTVEDLQHEIECIEGWHPSADGNSEYFQECLGTDNCIKTFDIIIPRYNYRGNSQAVLTIRSTDDTGHVEDYRTELPIGTEVFLAVIEFDPNRQYVHEVTIESPLRLCTVNGRA